MNLIQTVIDLISEQDLWVQKAASGPQKCGKGACWAGDRDLTGSSGSEGVRYEKPMSGRKLKKYNESLYNELLIPQKTSDYQQRYNTLSQNSGLNLVPGSINDNQKFAIVYNLTNKMTKNPDWFFNNYVRKEVGLSNNEPINDNSTLTMIKRKGGFDEFKDYYLTTIL